MTKKTNPMEITKKLNYEELLNLNGELLDFILSKGYTLGDLIKFKYQKETKKEKQ